MSYKEMSKVDNLGFPKAGRRETALDLVLNSFKELLLKKTLKPGDLIPSENVIAGNLGVSRGSVREAMKILSAFGIVEIKQGNGTYISQSIGKSLLDPFLLSLMLSDNDARQLVELREMIELKVVELVVRNGDEEGIAEIDNALQKMIEELKQGDTIQPDDLVQLDISFHNALGYATKNKLVEKLYSFILEFFKPYIEKTYSRPGNAQKALGLHEDIIKAIKAKDTISAIKATRQSIAEWESLFK